jgi:hypothetical protein
LLFKQANLLAACRWIQDNSASGRCRHFVNIDETLKKVEEFMPPARAFGWNRRRRRATAG